MQQPRKARHHEIRTKHQGPFFLCFAHRNVQGPIKPNPQFQGTSEIGGYGDFTHKLDWSVGQVLDALDRHGLAETTLLFFSSDNGAVQERGEPKESTNLYLARAEKIAEPTRLLEQIRKSERSR